MPKFLKGRRWWEWLFLAAIVSAIVSTIVKDIQAEPFGFAAKVFVFVFLGIIVLAGLGAKG